MTASRGAGRGVGQLTQQTQHAAGSAEPPPSRQRLPGTCSTAVARIAASGLIRLSHGRDPACL